MSLVHPLSTGSASKSYKCFDGELLFFPFSWLLCPVSCELSLVEVENVEVGFIEGGCSDLHVLYSFSSAMVIVVIAVKRLTLMTFRMWWADIWVLKSSLPLIICCSTMSF